MKILIVTAWYYPFIHPRAHRWTVLAEHWAAEGHEVLVLTARVGQREKQEDIHGVQVHRTGFDSLKEWVYFQFGSRQARGRVGVIPQRSGPFARLTAWTYQHLWKNLFFPDDACIWYFPAKRKMRQLLENQDFNLLITVSLPFSGHLLGLDFFKKRKAGKYGSRAPFWIADIGDPFSFQARSPNNPYLYGRLNQQLERQVLECADALSVTTPATLEKYRFYFGDGAVERMHVIPPLLAWIPTFNKRLLSKERIRMGYFGALYAPTRTPDAFLELLAQTFSFRPDLRDQLEIHFYGEIFPEFFEKFQGHTNIRLHGLRSREAVNLAMQDMDILLHIGNTTDFQLPSKAVDYLASGLPVLHLSYVEVDPFISFFQEATRLGPDSPLFVLKLENGKISDRRDILNWIEWLESEKPAPKPADLQKLLQPYLISAVASQYLELIYPSK